MKIRVLRNANARLKQLAYSMTEVLVGVSLTGVLFVSLYGGMSSGFMLTQVARENLRATQIMMERVEGIRLYNWNQLCYSNWVPESFTNSYYPVTAPGESPGIQYIGRMSITDPVMSPATTYHTNMRAVVVTVDWVSAGVPRSRSMITYVAKNGMQNYVYGTSSMQY